MLVNRSTKHTHRASSLPAFVDVDAPLAPLKRPSRLRVTSASSTGFIASVILLAGPGTAMFSAINLTSEAAAQLQQLPVSVSLESAPLFSPCT
jgi:hypothetical protein